IALRTQHLIYALRITHHALRSTQNPQLATLNPQPILRFTLYAPQGYNLGIKAVINKRVRKKQTQRRGKR
ncbi:hypothetical protein, partial [Fervidibacter sp.]